MNRVTIIFVALCAFIATALAVDVEVSPSRCSAGCSVTIRCAGPGVSIVKASSPDVFTALNATELRVRNSNEINRVKNEVVDSSGNLKGPWTTAGRPYAASKTNDGVQLRINSSVAEDSGYYGCKSGATSYKMSPLLIYKDVSSVAGKFLSAASVKFDPDSGGLLTGEFDSMDSPTLTVVVEAEVPYALMKVEARLEDSNETVGVSPLPQILRDNCDSSGVFCAYQLLLGLQVEVANSSSAHLRKLVVGLRNPDNNRLLWRSAMLLRDSHQSAKIVDGADVQCQPSSSEAVVVKYHTGLRFACSLPRRWLQLAAARPAWRFVSEKQFFPNRTISCGYDHIKALEAAGKEGEVKVDDSMQDLDANVSCRSSLQELQVRFHVGAKPEGRVEFTLEILEANYVHQGREIFFIVDAVKEYTRELVVTKKFTIKIEEDPTTAAWKPQTAATLVATCLAVAMVTVFAA